MRRSAGDLARLDGLLDQALGLSVDAREAFLRDLAGREPVVAEEVRALVDAAGRSGVTDGLEENVDAVRQAIEPRAAVLGTLEAGERVGPYRILQLIGYGGMAAVYLAERVDGGFSQRVALKIVPRDLLSADALGRFEQERQILANLDHPHIARLFDGGVDARGRSYIAMEYVEGVPIDRYCAERQLSIAERLAVFVQVVDAVQFAHRHLVIHRDIKPSNILVTSADAGNVKLLDFGIAKLLDSNAAGAQATLETQTLYRVLTPGYASPEQLRGAAVTTASDVYQLGLLLYELLTGVRATSTSTPVAPSIAAAAISTTPRAHAKALRGDLDNIVLKALESDPARRYESPAALAHDLDRYRRGEPVSARTATRRYRLSKFVRRHRVGVAVTAVITCVLVGLIATLAWQTYMLRLRAERIRVEAAKAGEIRDFLTSLFDVPLDEYAPALSARELIDRAASRVASTDQSQPLVRAQMMHTLGGLYLRLGQYDRAKQLIDESLGIRRRLLGDNNLDTAESLLFLGIVSNLLEDHVRAEAAVRQAVAVGERVLGPNHWGVAFALQELGNSLMRQRRFEEAEPIFTRAAAIYRRYPKSAMGAPGAPTNSLGLLRAQKGDYEGAIRYYRDALAINTTRFGAAHPLVQTNRFNLASALVSQGNLAEAEALLRDVMATRQRMLGKDHPETASAMVSLGEALRKRDNRVEAQPLLADALAVYEKRYPPGHSRIADAHFYLGRVLAELGRQPEAEPHLRFALASLTTRYGATHKSTVEAQRLLDDRGVAKTKGSM
jgi:serine/threonine-protein kinase